MELIFISIVIILCLLLVVVIRAQKKHLNALSKKYVEDQWERICDEHDPRNQLLNADILLDQAMAKAGYRGKNLGQKLKTYSQVFSDLNGTWWAHKLRNKLAHELDFTPTQKETDKALRLFKKALNDLGADL